MTTLSSRSVLPFTLIAAASLFGGCSSDSASGRATVILEPESTITDGIRVAEMAPGDGWSVDFERYLVALGPVSIGRTATSERLDLDKAVTIYDLAQTPSSGDEIGRFAGLEAGRWGYFGFRTPAASEGVVAGPGVTAALVERMTASGLTYVIEGTINAASGQRCPPGRDGCCEASEGPVSLRFSLDMPNDTDYGPCESDEGGLEGFAVPQNGSVTLAASIHGDHMFFDSCPEGIELVDRRAQWLANADLDCSGEVTAEELRDIPASALFPASLYSFAGCPIPVTTAYDWLKTQLHTQGHFQSEGECTKTPR